MARFLIVAAAMLCIAGEAVCQKRYLVSPRDEVIPLGPRATPASLIARRSSVATSSAVCGTEFIFGYPPTLYPTGSNFGAYHKDVIGQWFVAKATGTIDTVYWETLGQVGALDSILWFSIHTSVIGPDFGPGVRPGPYNPPCQNWGYWRNTNDLDQGIAPFADEATDTSWVSTYNGPVPSVPPVGEPLWAGAPVPVVDHANQINKIALDELGTALAVATGDKFFISLKVNGPAGHTTDTRTEFSATGFHVTATDELYPSRDWKFYEHDSGPGNCSGVSVEEVKRGWVARGGFSQDSLDVAVFNIWYLMTVTTNLPPDVIVGGLMTEVTFDTGARLIEAPIIMDCDPANPAFSGVASATIHWTLNGIPQADIPMTNAGGDSWRGTIPGNAIGSAVSYTVCATDSAGLISCASPRSYTIQRLNGYWYAADTGRACVSKSIAASGVLLPKGAFFLPAASPPGAGTGDNGTAGPIDMGSGMTFFGVEYRYLWIGIDGGIGLTAGASDTVHVNDSGRSPIDWSFTSTTVGVSPTMPRTYLAPLGTDLFYGDSVTTCGAIRYQKGYGDDTCLMIVEWDSVGAHAPLGGPTCDVTTFRVVLNLCDGTIEYQYDHVGGLGVQSAAIVGMTDSSWHTAPYTGTEIVNERGTPTATEPRDGWCIKFYPSVGRVFHCNAWNLVSLGVVPFGSCTPRDLFGVDIAYFFDGRYEPISNECMEPVRGYWVKSPTTGGAKGPLFTTDTCISVTAGWNLIGAPGKSIPVSAIGQTPPAIVMSNYFGYGCSGYEIASSLSAGEAYFVKVSADGELCFGSNNEPGKLGPSPMPAELNTISVSDASGRRQTLYLASDGLVSGDLGPYDMPPPAPEFDARYTSGRLLESYPAHTGTRSVDEFPISFVASYPVTFSWDIKEKNRRIVLEAGDHSFVMSESGRMTIENPSINRAVIRVSEGGLLPKEFGLGQNHPNPFNPSTTFELQVAKTGPVSLKIYDILGRMVATLVNEVREPGFYTITWDADNFPTGVYFAKMTAGDFTASRKLMLMK